MEPVAQLAAEQIPFAAGSALAPQGGNLDPGANGWDGRGAIGTGNGAAIGTGIGTSIGAGYGAGIGTSIGAGYGAGIGTPIGAGNGAGIGTPIGAGERGRAQVCGGGPCWAVVRNRGVAGDCGAPGLDGGGWGGRADGGVAQGQDGALSRARV